MEIRVGILSAQPAASGSDGLVSACYPRRVALPRELPPYPIARFTVERYHRMIEAGVFTEDDRVELLEGWVVQQMAKGPAHAYSTRQIDHELSARVPATMHVRNQEPITLETSEPEPDIAIVRGPAVAYRERHPYAGEVALVVEVSDSSIDTDRLKGRAYGRAGIPQYWIVNLPDRCVEVNTVPSHAAERGYANVEIVHAGELAIELEGVEVRLAIERLLP